MSDQINHPPHYGGEGNPYETIKVIERWALDFNLGNVIKYISRAGLKNESTGLEDLKKAKWYLDREIQTFEQNARYREEIRQEVEAEYADRTGGVREQHNNDALSKEDSGDNLLPESRQGSDPQGNEPVPGGEEEKGSVPRPYMPEGWRWDDDTQKFISPDQDRFGKVDSNAESVRLNQARKAEVAERLRKLEPEQAAQIIRAYQNEAERQKKDVHEAFKEAEYRRVRAEQELWYEQSRAHEAFLAAIKLRDKELDGNATE